MPPAALLILAGVLALAGGWWFLIRQAGACVPPGPRHVVGIGDSLTVPGLWGAELLRHLPPGSTVRSFGNGGTRTDYILSMLPSVLAQAPQATDLVILAGVNDAAQGIPAAQAGRNLAGMWDLGKGRGLRVVTVCLTPWKGHKYFRGDLTAALNLWIKNTASVAVATEALGKDGTLLRAYDGGDGLHMNSTGHAALGRLIFDQAFRICGK